ncbi:MAG: methyltransferase domain-containing protein [bacterium]|nr:methyltransferase domain-containing protein [bacterium]
MRRRHFEALGPICPVCRTGPDEAHPLEIATALREREGVIFEGVLQCRNPECLREYPIIDAVPLIISELRAFASGNFAQLYARDDLSETIESILGDCCGPGSAFDTTRQHLSTYAQGHYGDLDPDPEAGERDAGSIVELLERAVSLAGDLPRGPVIDVGCAVGRTSFMLAEQRDQLVLGVDLDFSMLRLATRVLHDGLVRYPRRRVGVVYDRREWAVDFPRRENVDFWACDATALPFPAASFAAAASLNVIDCVSSPRDSLLALAGVMVPGGKALIATPYDWSAAATPIEAWLGGHSQRGAGRGASAPVLVALLTPGAHPAAVPGLEIIAEEPALAWRVRMHERATVEYRVHLVIARAQG